MDDTSNSIDTTGIKPLGLCLSGGGAIGFAHIGVLQALLENDIEPAVVSGSSMGAIVGAMYAAGVTPAEMIQIIKDDRLFKVSKLMNIKPSFWRSGFSTHQTIQTVIKETIPHNSFEGLPKKLMICVVNASTMKWEIIQEGNELSCWVSASAAIPGIFETFEKNGYFYLDGGVLNNMPAQPLAPLCRAIIGVDVLPFIPPQKMKRPVEAMTCAIRGVQHVNSEEGRSLCNYIIEPKAVLKFHEFRFDAFERIYKSGYKETVEFIKKNPDIKSL